jgi:hypothetical protein
MNIPESKPATDWASEWLGYNVGPEQKRLVEWIDEIKANAAAHARYQALTEAAEASRKIEFEQTRSIHGFIDTRDSFCIEKAILSLRDAKET